ncbi:protein kinase [Hahella aquimaris]|uniref:serine/threonine protein kinase n=1 Tax=Hahella sp. HNIBRBA332 TaxID=3015983 RepID=UPI00273B0764|nr:serine/threonine-protein kinase [Hahella sp. HNIBRBA332]WLQ16298.1 protein kinase [Hahella sp. HNIBRBA332]
MEFPDIPGYTIHKLLGKGGMAAVYLATQESLNRKVAIKILTEFGDESAERRFFSEARTVAGLRHPHIIVVHDVARLEDGKPYITMEYVSGGDLTLLKGRPQKPEYVLDIVRQVAEALKIVHDKGVIHRDIKPANILFHSDDSIVLTDFGIAKDTAINTDMTIAGYSVGSPSYSSPEQAYGKPLDARSDIYSLGVVFLELLVGRNPFKGSNYTETIVNHTEKPTPDLSDVPESCREIIARMLAKNPEDRYANADALLADLRRALTDDDATLVRNAAPQTSGLAAGSLRPIDYLTKNKLIAGGLMGAMLAVVLFFGLYESETDKKINALLQQAESRIAANSLIEPEFDNAQYFYNQVLSIDPGNDDALNGLKEIDERLVDRYLTLAAERFEQRRLTIPAGDNAVFYYRKVLGMDSDNQLAQDGLKRVVSEYIAMANDAFNRKEYGKGLRYVDSGLNVEPDNQELQSLKSQYEKLSNPIKRFFNNVLN